MGVDFSASPSICEIGCGAGQVLGYFLNKYDKARGYGIDLNSELIEYGNKAYQSKGFSGELVVDDLYSLSETTKDHSFEGLMMLQVINILPEYEKAIKSLQDLNHNWLAFSALGFEGNIDYVCTLYDYNKPKETHKILTWGGTRRNSITSGLYLE